MNRTLELKYRKLLFSEVQIDMYLDILRTREHAIRVLSIIARNTYSKQNASGKGITASQLLVRVEGIRSRYHMQDILCLLKYSTLIYEDEVAYISNQKMYQLTWRGAQIYKKILKETNNGY